MCASSDVVVTSDAAGSLGFGAYLKHEWFSGAWGPSQSDQSIAIKSYSLWWSPRTFRVRNGINATSSSVRTARQWCTFLRPGHRGSCPLCSFYTIYCPWQLDIILPLQPYICQALIIRLLMLSLIFIGRSSGVWLRRFYRTQFQFVNSFGIF